MKPAQAIVYRGSKEGTVIEGKETFAPGDEELLLKITHSGLCGTDIHYFEYGQVLGHEGVGIVIDIGKNVPQDLFSRGDVLGFGIQLNSCGMCSLCLEGQEIYCPKRRIQSLHLLNRGSFSSHYLVSYRFVFRIPEGIHPIHAAPLMGAGATAFSALYNFDVRPTDRIAIVGLGGVGHLAVQFAHAWGCGVTVLSTSMAKHDDAMKLGAAKFVITNGNWTKNLQGTIDVLLMVANIKPDQWDEYISILKPRGKIILVTAGRDTLAIPYTPIIQQGFRIFGSLTASRKEMNLMLEFADIHKIVPWVETGKLDLDGIQHGVDRLRKGLTRYRFVAVADDGAMEIGINSVD